MTMMTMMTMMRTTMRNSTLVGTESQNEAAMGFGVWRDLFKFVASFIFKHIYLLNLNL